MTTEMAQQLFESGRSHTLSSELLYRAALNDAEERGLPDPEQFAFNGTFSLSIHYLLGLGLELMLKSAIIAWGGPSDEKSMRKIGHNLVTAVDVAEEAGFVSEAPNLRAILEVLNEPYMQHWLRYERPKDFPLPGDFTQVVDALEVFDNELKARLWEE